MKTVSVILPVYNADTYLPLALASLLLQDHEALELICINDGSTDLSGDILRKAASQDPRVVVVERENRGLIATLNEGFQRASGDLVARMDADDIAYPTRISTQVQAFAQDPELAMSGCFFHTLFSANRMLPTGTPEATGMPELRVLSRFYTILRHPTVMFRRSAMPEGMLQYDEAYPCAEDFDLFRRIARDCKVAQTSEPLLAYRLHDGSVSATRMSEMVRSHVKIVEEELARHYPEAAGTGFDRIGDQVSADTVDRASDLIRRLNGLAASQPPEEAKAYRMGIENVFYFLFSHIRGQGRHDLAHRFIDQSGRWDMIRRRERPILQASRHAPVVGTVGYSLLKASWDASKWLGSCNAATVIPEFPRITARAADLALRHHDGVKSHA